MYNNKDIYLLKVNLHAITCNNKNKSVTFTKFVQHFHT